MLEQLKKLITRIYMLSVLFLLVENGSTYLGLTMKKGLVEVGPTFFFISYFGLKWGIVLAFILGFTLATLLLIYHQFRYLTALCFGLLASALNDSYAVFFGVSPLGDLPLFLRYLTQTLLGLIGYTYAWAIERKAGNSKHR